MKDQRITGLDGIRLWAILLIVAEHTGFIRENGAVGVALCFVLSGFLTVYSPKREDPADSFFSLKQWLFYYLRRFFRIVPLYYFCVLFFWFFYPAICFGSWESVFRHLTFQECGIHFWYLQQEVVMYLFVPPIFLVLALLHRLFRGKWQVQWLYIALLLLAAWYCKLYPLFTLPGNGQQQPFRIYLFLMGMATGYFCRLVRLREWKLTKMAKNTLAVIGNLWMLAAFLITLLSSPQFLIYFGIDMRETYYSVQMDIPFGIVAMLWIIAAVLCRRGPVAVFFGNPVFVHLSERSYGIYLFHFLLRLSLGVADGVMMFLLDTFMSICVAEVLYALIEKPLGDFGKHLSVKKLGAYYKGLLGKC